MCFFLNSKFIIDLNHTKFHRENLTTKDKLFIDSFVEEHQVRFYRTASAINSDWLINDDTSCLMFRLGGGIPKDGETSPFAFGLIFKNQPLVFKANITYDDLSQPHWNIIELIIDPKSTFAELNKKTIFKIIEFFVKNGFHDPYLFKLIPKKVEVDFSKFKRIRAVGDHRIFRKKNALDRIKNIFGFGKI